MRRLLCCFVLPLFLTACGSAAKQAPPTETPENGKPTSSMSRQGAAKAPVALAFGWKIPCRVPVEQFADKKGHTARMRYILSVKQGPEGKLDADMSDFEFLEVDGQDVTSPKMQAQMAPAIALTNAMPTMVISPEGAYLGMRGLDEMVERVIAYYRKAKGMKKDEEEKVAAMMRSPMMMATLENKVGDYWNSWVGAWVGLELAPFEAREGDDSVPLGNEQIPVRLRYEHHGLVKEAPGFVRMSITQTIGGNSASTGILAFVRAMLKDGGMALPGDIVIDYANMVNKIESELDPATLRPRHTVSKRSIELVVEGKRRKSEEVREETFDWDKAQGCR